MTVTSLAEFARDRDQGPATPELAPVVPSPALPSDPRTLGLSRIEVSTDLGLVAVRCGRRTASTTATVFLHGAAGSWSTWGPLLSAVDAAKGRRMSDVVLVDLPGWGDSPGPRHADDLTLDALARVVERVADALGYRRVRLVGHSLGAFVALHVAATAPALVESVRLVSPATFGVVAVARHPVARAGILPGYAGLLAGMRVLAGLGTPGRGLVRLAGRAGRLGGLVSPLFRHPELVDPTVVAALAREVRPRGFVRAAEEAARYDPARSWSRIRCEVRSVHGDDDVFVAASDDDRLARTIPHFESVVIAEAGHFAHVERPAAVATALRMTDRG